jgi:purine-cytosine permease-like protein
MMPLVGVTTSFIFFNLLSVGLASGNAGTPAWSDAYDVSSGALILAGYDSLGGFGKFWGVIIVLGLDSNVTASNYAAALDFQVLGRAWRAVPRHMSGPRSQQ